MRSPGRVHTVVGPGVVPDACDASPGAGYHRFPIPRIVKSSVGAGLGLRGLAVLSFTLLRAAIGRELPAGTCHACTYHPQLYICPLELATATVYSAPQTTRSTPASVNAEIAQGDVHSSACPCPNCPSSPRPQEATMPQPSCKQAAMRKQA